jgi:hypothetical protein
MRILYILFAILLIGDCSKAQPILYDDLYRKTLEVYQQYIKKDTICVIVEDSTRLKTSGFKFYVQKIMTGNVRQFLLSLNGKSMFAIKMRELAESNNIAIFISEYGISFDKRNQEIINMVYSGGEKFVYRKNKGTGKYKLMKQIHLEF